MPRPLTRTFPSISDAGRIASRVDPARAGSWVGMADMMQIRRQHSLSSSLIVAPVLGLVLAYVPWPASAVLAALVILHWLVVTPRLRWIHWAWIYIIAGIVVGLMVPGGSSHGGRGG